MSLQSQVRSKMLRHSTLDTLSPGNMCLGGHRGMGENLLTLGGCSTKAIVPAVRENTIGSFQAAAQMGCSFVEFDVQVTKDGHAVIWHDDKIVLGNGMGCTSCEVKDLTLVEFKNIVPRSRAVSDIDNMSLGGHSDDFDTASVQSSASFTSSGVLMRTFKDADSLAKMESPEPWMCDEDHNLPTLRELFEGLPAGLGFNVEVKMTTGENVERTSDEELNRVVNGMMREVDTYCPVGTNQDRPLVFSSFDPDIVSLLSQRLAVRYPVFFLSGCGIYKHVDPRRTSIDSAIAHAVSSNLAGVVVPVSKVQQFPGLVADARSKNLGVMTYGHENSDPDAILFQQELGVLAAIIDSVASVIPGLRKYMYSDEPKKFISLEDELQVAAV
eukprot:gene8685-34132_t